MDWWDGLRCWEYMYCDELVLFAMLVSDLGIAEAGDNMKSSQAGVRA
jgi:hypothetical protein